MRLDPGVADSAAARSAAAGGFSVHTSRSAVEVWGFLTGVLLSIGFLAVSRSRFFLFLSLEIGGAEGKKCAVENS